jgi:hypothetical protein
MFCNNNIWANYRIFKQKIYGDVMRNPMGHVKDNQERKPKKLLDLAREILRRKHYSIFAQYRFMDGH